MLRPIILFCLLCSFSLASYAPNQIIVQQRTLFSPQSKSSANRKLSAAIQNKLSQYGAFTSSYLAETTTANSGVSSQSTGFSSGGTAYHLITFSSSQNIELLLSELKQDPEILSVQPNYEYTLMATPADPLLSSQNYLQQISALEGWDKGTGNASVLVAVIDSGANINHEDLLARIHPAYWNAVSNNTDVSDTSAPIGHGTLVAGIIGAEVSNNKGIAGIDWNCQVLVIRVFNAEGKSYSSYLIAAINYAMQSGHKADVINMSLGSSERDAALEATCKQAWDNGAILVAAMGNSWVNQSAIFYPAGFTQVIGVGSVNRNNNLSGFSCYGNGTQTTDVVAPGEYILSTSAGANNTYTDSESGTSFSTPMVSALAALLKARYPSLSNTEIREIIQNACIPLGNGYEAYKYGHGLINVVNALERASGYVPQKSITNIMNYPNPITDGTTKFSFQTEKSIQSAEFIIYDLRGREVSRLTSGSSIMVNGGTYRSGTWDCTDNSGKPLPNGSYIYTIKAIDVNGGTQKARGKLAIVR